jgi:hypothetical protein
MYFSRDQIYTELKRLYDVYNPCKRTFGGIGRQQLEDDQVRIYTSYRWKGPEGRWILTNYYNGKYMDVIVPIEHNSGEEDSIGECYSKITFDPYVPKAVGEALNLVWKEREGSEGSEGSEGCVGGFVDMLGNKLIIEYHYKNREEYLISFLSPDEVAAATARKQTQA